ncbi:MAG TPA: transposase [Gammaproteobacteria bacterium]|nr:transposase [Gammaproteobacteria bacterium]
MTNYRRTYLPGRSWFFTVSLAEREGNNLLTKNVNELRNAFRQVKKNHPFDIDAIVILPDHLHCIWTLPKGDADFSQRWNLIKGKLSRTIDRNERISESRLKRRERGIWQRRFWEHMIRDQNDFNRHVDYIHWNPVKHGWTERVVDWPYSSFHDFVEKGVYSESWGL